MIKVIIEITRFSDHKTVTFKDKYKDAELCRFMWDEGNYGCDCNRSLYFHRNEKPKKSEEQIWKLTQCGNGHFYVRIIHEKSKRVIFNDLPEISQ